MESNGHTFKPGDVLAPKDYWKVGNMVIVVVEASRWTNDIPVYKILVNRETNSVDFELMLCSETWLPKYYFKEGHISIANYNWDYLKNILEGSSRGFHATNISRTRFSGRGRILSSKSTVSRKEKKR